MKIQHIVGYKLKKQQFHGFKILKVYYVGKDKDNLHIRAIYKNLSYASAEQKMYELESNLK